MYLVGADPELFVRQGVKLKSAHGLVPGTKREPYKVDKGAVQVDGMALEFNINPATSEDEFVNNINSVLAVLRDMVPKKYNFSFRPASTFSEQEFEEAPGEAKELGCEPDFNAYNKGNANQLPEHAKESRFRTTSGHVHIGWTNGADINDPAHKHDCCILAMQLDLFLAAPFMEMYGNKAEVDRRKLYGGAGCFRPKSYGMEYRTMSNRWLKDEKLQRWVYNNTIKAIQYLDFKRIAVFDELDIYTNDMRMYINTFQGFYYYASVSTLFNSYKVPMPPKVLGV